MIQIPEPDPCVRSVTDPSLGERGDPRAAEASRGLLDVEPPAVREDAAEALAQPSGR